MAEQVELNRGTKLVLTADKAWNMTTDYRGKCTIGVDEQGAPFIHDPEGSVIEATFEAVR